MWFSVNLPFKFLPLPVTDVPVNAGLRSESNSCTVYIGLVGYAHMQQDRAKYPGGTKYPNSRVVV